MHPIADTMLISIIVPIYNIAPYIRACLDSCVEQTYRDIEVICVDDGSTDESGYIADEYAAHDKRFRVIHKANGGLPSARKAGIEAAKGEYVFHLDGDDNIPLDAIEKLIAVATKESADIVIGDSVTITDTAHYETNSGITRPLTSEEYIHYILVRGLFNIWGRLIRASLYKDNPIEFPLHISIAEDLVQTFQLAHFAGKVCACHEICYYYYVRHTSMSKTDNVVGQLTDRAIYAVLYILKYSLTHSPFARKDLNRYIANFVYTYLCSPYPVSLRKSELHELMKCLNYRDIREIKEFSRRAIMSLAFINLGAAKSIVSTYASLKNIWKSND